MKGVAGDLIRKGYESMGYTQPEFAEEAGVGLRTLRRAVNEGEASAKTVNLVANALGVEPGFLQRPVQEVEVQSYSRRAADANVRVPWNLFFSAEEAIESASPPPAALLDLCQLIDLLVWADQLVVDGVPGVAPFAGHPESRFLQELRHAHLVEVRDAGSNRHEVVDVALMLLCSWVPSSDRAGLRGALEESLNRSLIPPEEASLDKNSSARKAVRDSAKAEAVVRSLPRIDDPAVASFLVRAALLCARAFVERRPLACDTRRASLVGSLGVRHVLPEHFGRERVRQQLERAWRQHPPVYEARLRHRVSPFAAVAFRRAQGDRGRVLGVALGLRAELEPLRAGLNLAHHVEEEPSAEVVLAIETLAAEAARVVSLAPVVAALGTVAPADGDPRLALVAKFASELPGPADLRRMVDELMLVAPKPG